MANEHKHEHDGHMFGATDASDSAGQPWAGRRFEPNAHSADDGSADPAVVAALTHFRSLDLTDPARAAAQSAVINAVAASRLLVPLIAEAGETGIGPNGLVVDKTQELALITVAGPAGQQVMPAFTSVAAMTAWRADARPVPVDARRAALAAVAEGINWIVLDPASPTEFVIRRPVVAAIAQGIAWTPSHVDVELRSVFEKSASVDPAVRSIRMVAGDPDARGVTDDVILQVELAPGLEQDEVMRVLNALSTAWAGETIFAERIDSMKIQVIPAAS
ncbi:MAG: SseB family protein [Actinobacteria bacterium]|nr:SseB family protein [Actinomycetota bacterium]